MSEAIPHRHGADVTTGRRMAAGLRSFIHGDPEPTPERWEALGRGLLQGDPLADDVAAWVADVGMATAHPTIERALRAGIATVPEAPVSLRSLLQACEVRPDPVDDDLVRQGARFFQRAGLSA